MDQSLDSGNAIAAALLAKGGNGVITRLAKKHGISRPYLSQTIHGQRKARAYIQILANYLGQPVYGITPKQD